MANILHKTNGDGNPQGKPRVYFTCHPDDFEKHFETICADLFKAHDCAVYYTEDMSEPIPEADLATDLESRNLFVVPVTLKLLTEPNRAMDHDIPFALRKHIPVLPIMMDTDIDSIYARPDKFGELQYLCPHGGDGTEISYEDKLKKHLESILINDHLAKRIRAAFSAYIFLSYRKKDRRYANELMRLIHKNPEYQDIAIWFDEFLTPGESFRENIEKMVKDCNLFTLLVTPHILEKVKDEDGQWQDNYVLSTELPLARKKKEQTGEDIVAVEMEQTDRERLKAIAVAVNVTCSDENFPDELVSVLEKIAKKPNDNEPIHTFFMGLAYLDGIDVETDRERGLALITGAAEEGLPEAMEKLYAMYSEGIGVPINYPEAATWAKCLVGYYTDFFGTEENPSTLRWLHNLALMYYKSGQYRKAYQQDEISYNLHCKVLGPFNPDTLASLNNFALSCDAAGYPERALELSKNAYDLYCEHLGATNPRTLHALNNLAHAYSENNNPQEAWTRFKEVYDLRRDILGTANLDTLSALNNYACACGDLGDLEAERDLLEQAHTLFCDHYGPEFPETLNTLSNLAYVYYKLAEQTQSWELMEESLERHKKAYNLQCKILGGPHPKTLGTLNNMAVVYSRLGKIAESLEASETVCKLLRETLGESHPKAIDALTNLAYNHHNCDSLPRAAEVMEIAYELFCRLYGPTDRRTQRLLDNMYMTYLEIGDEKSRNRANELLHL